jgi:hypothetical protein
MRAGLARPASHWILEHQKLLEIFPSKLRQLKFGFLAIETNHIALPSEIRELMRIPMAMSRRMNLRAAFSEQKNHVIFHSFGGPMGNPL